MTRGRKRKVDDLGELEERKAEIEALRVEARSYGVYVTTSGLPELRKIVGQIRQSREGMPPCYWISYDKRARECRICDVATDCSRGEDISETVPTDELRPVACKKCGAGMLSVEVVDKRGRVLDYGCSRPECDGVLGEQARHVEIPAPVKVAKKAPPDPGRAVRKKMLRFLVHNPGARIAETLAAGGIVAQAIKRGTLKQLVAEGKIQREKVKGTVRLFVAGDV
ncbi:MAG: hypothetical protein KJN79_09390 [Gammaproteobacteria bacterium]|nr:hypothetical protein [Gammaproteobacteria bacterium]